MQVAKTLRFKQDVCALCRYGRIKQNGSHIDYTCTVENARVRRGVCNKYRR